MIDRFLGDAFVVLSCQFWNIVLQSGLRLPIHTLNYWTEQSVVPGFQLGVCLNVTFIIVDPWQSCACFTRSGVSRCTLLTVLSLDHMCQRRLHAVFGSHIDTLIHRLAAEPIQYRTNTEQQYSRTFILFSVSLWNDLASPVFDGVGLAGFKSRANASLLA